MNKCPKTRLEFYWNRAWVKLEVESRGNPRFRRTLLLSLYRKIEPLVRQNAIEECIFHIPRKGGDPDQLLKRGISLHQAPEVGTREGRVGFEIRMRRLEMGLSQKQFAAMAGITRSHLSRIEMGRLLPSERTIGRIRRGMGAVRTEECRLASVG